MTKARTTKKPDAISKRIAQQVHQMHMNRRIPVRRPRAQRLPELADGAIAALETLAAEIGDLRQQRAKLAADEEALKVRGLVAMKKLKRDHYAHDGIEIQVRPGTEVISIKVKRPPRDLGDDSDAAEALDSLE